MESSESEEEDKRGKEDRGLGSGSFLEASGRRQKSCFLQGKFAAGLLLGFGDKEVLSLASGSSEHYRVCFIVASRCLGAA